MHVDGRWTVRSLLPADDHLPCTGSGALMATLEALGRPLLRGNRSRILLVAAELERALEQVVGTLQAYVLCHRVPAGESVRAWAPSVAGKLLVAEAFSVELVSVHRRDDAIRPLPKASFARGEEIVFALRSHVSTDAEVVVIVELAEQESSSHSSKGK